MKSTSLTEAKPPFIRSVEHNFSVKTGETLAITLKADWPTPSWEHMDTTINISTEERTVTISYLGLRRAGVALQQIKSFEVVFDLILHTPGEWSLTVLGRSENWESVIEVT